MPLRVTIETNSCHFSTAIFNAKISDVNAKISGVNAKISGINAPLPPLISEGELVTTAKEGLITTGIL